MPLYIPASASDVLIVSTILLSQWLLFWFLLCDWKSRVSTFVWRVVLVGLILLWTICGVGLLLALFAPHSPLVWAAHLRRVAVSIELSWGCLSVATITIYAVFRKLWAGDRDRFSPARRRVLERTAAVAVALPAAIGGYGTFIERKRFYVKEVDLPVTGLHPDLAGLRLAQVSDLHVSAYLSVADCARIVDMTNELKPDLTLVTGDIISDFGDPLEEAIRELGRLRATAGILGCHGNHEVYARCQNLASRLCSARGIDILRQKSRQLKFGNGVLNVAGVDYQPSGTRKNYLPRAESLILSGATNLLLSHTPDVFPVAVRKGFDAVISGHTHAGQVTVEILNQTLNVARFVTPYVAGLYRIDKRSCYVTAGIGTIGMPIRLGAPPEITLLRLQPA